MHELYVYTCICQPLEPTCFTLTAAASSVLSPSVTSSTRCDWLFICRDTANSRGSLLLIQRDYGT